MSAKTLLTPAIQILAGAMPNAVQQVMLGPFIPLFIIHRLCCKDLGISGLPPSYLTRSLEYLRKRKYNFVSLEDAVEILESGSPPPPRTVAFSVDDGFKEQYDIGAPIFSKFDCPATYFLITDFINGEIWPWDDQISYMVENSPLTSINLLLPSGPASFSIETYNQQRVAARSIVNELKSVDNSDIYQGLHKFYNDVKVTTREKPPEEYLPMTWADARKLENDGHYVGAHSKSHRILSQLGDNDSKEEILGSVAEIDKHCSGSSLFCYPTGRKQDFGQREIDFIRNSKIKAAVSSIPVTATPGYRYNLPRFSMPSNEFDLVQYTSWIEISKKKFAHKYQF